VENTQQLLADLHAAGCSAIGEIGLDKACGVDLARQLEVFEQQVVVACSRNLPIVIHCVKAQQEVVNVLTHYSTPSVIFHGFIGSPQQAEQLWQNGYYLSFGFGALKSPKTVNVLRHCPMEQLFLESDTAKEPISLLDEQVAIARGVGVEELRESIYNNYNRIFK
jgi:TatD DNase family protein